MHRVIRTCKRRRHSLAQVRRGIGATQKIGRKISFFCHGIDHVPVRIEQEEAMESRPVNHRAEIGVKRSMVCMVGLDALGAIQQIPVRLHVGIAFDIGLCQPVG